MPVGRVSAGNTQAGIWQTDAKWKIFSLTFFSIHFQIIFLLPLFKSLYCKLYRFFKYQESIG